MVIGETPDHLTLPFCLWTRAALAQLIAREYRSGVSLSTACRYLKGMSPQKPARRGCEHNDETMQRWLLGEYAAIVREAKRDHAMSYWGDDTWLRGDHLSATSYAPFGPFLYGQPVLTFVAVPLRTASVTNW